ncbi:MAG: hypothetical protein HYZ50_08535 [Deltaproteobacteria bacterium]|nr:hypothetical protein [Deltaproteobacteria bacterium]
MLETIGHWWNSHKGEVRKCTMIMLGSLVWYVGQEFTHWQRLPFVSPLSQDGVPEAARQCSSLREER